MCKFTRRISPRNRYISELEDLVDVATDHFPSWREPIDTLYRCAHSIETLHIQAFAKFNVVSYTIPERSRGAQGPS